MAKATIKKTEIKICQGSTTDLLKCAGRKGVENYYASWNPLHDGYLPYCKDCCNRLVEYYLKKTKSMQGALYYTCSTLNIPFIRECYEKTMETKSSTTNNKFFGVYYGNILKRTSKRDFWLDFTNSDTDLKDVESKLVTAEVRQAEIDKFLLDWGKQDDPMDYRFLEMTFERYTKGVVFVNQQQEDLYRDLCHDRLALRKMNDKRYEGTETRDNVQKRIARTMAILKVDEFESNKPKTISEQLMFAKIAQIEQNKPADLYKEPKKFKDFNKFEKYEKDMVLRPLLNTLAGHRDFDINIEDIEQYDLDSE